MPNGSNRADVRAYNTRHSFLRNAVERLWAVAQARFKTLRAGSDIRDRDFLIQVVHAYFILHNMVMSQPPPPLPIGATPGRMSEEGTKDIEGRKKRGSEGGGVCGGGERRGRHEQRVFVDLHASVPLP